MCHGSFNVGIQLITLHVGNGVAMNTTSWGCMGLRLSQAQSFFFAQSMSSFPLEAAGLVRQNLGQCFFGGEQGRK